MLILLTSCQETAKRYAFAYIWKKNYLTVKQEDYGNLLALIYESAQIGMCLTDEHGLFVNVNPAYCIQYGYTKEELLGNHFSMVVPEALKEIATQMHDDFIAGSMVELPGEWEVVRKSGEIRKIFVTAGRFQDSEGKRYKVTTVADVTEQKQQLQDLENTIKERDALAKEIQHRVKNILNLVNSLIYLQVEKLKGNPEAQKELNVTRQRVMSLTLLYESNLTVEDTVKLQLNEYLGKLVQLLVQSEFVKQPVKLELQLEEILVTLDEAIPMGLLVNELVINALQHAFPQENAAGHLLTLNLTREEGTIHLTVRDNGIGLPADVLNIRSNHLGMQLIESISHQLKGKYTFNSTPETGTSFHIIIPVKEAVLTNG